MAPVSQGLEPPGNPGQFTLRPYLYVHKGATQGFLALFRAWFNLRTRRWGRHKGTSAHECLTGQPVYDWLTLLGYPALADAALISGRGCAHVSWTARAPYASGRSRSCV